MVRHRYINVCRNVERLTACTHARVNKRICITTKALFSLFTLNRFLPTRFSPPLHPLPFPFSPDTLSEFPSSPASPYLLPTPRPTNLFAVNGYLLVVQRKVVAATNEECPLPGGAHDSALLGVGRDISPCPRTRKNLTYSGWPYRFSWIRGRNQRPRRGQKLTVYLKSVRGYTVHTVASRRSHRQVVNRVMFILTLLFSPLNYFHVLTML